MAIREAELTDLNTVISLGKEFTEKRLGFLTFDTESIERYIKYAIEDDEHVVYLLDDDQGVLIGVINGNMFSREVAADEMMWYARESSGGKGIHLLRRFIRWAKEKKCNYVTCAIEQQTPAMERLGFTNFQTTYGRQII